MLAEVNHYIIGRRKLDGKEEPASDHDDAGNSGGEESGNQGTLILDATCCPQNIRFPTDASLLNEGRELLEGMIDTAHEAGATEGRKPRTYRNLARRTGCVLRETGNRPTRRSAKRSGSNWGTSSGI